MYTIWLPSAQSIYSVHLQASSRPLPLYSLSLALKTFVLHFPALFPYMLIPWEPLQLRAPLLPH